MLIAGLLRLILYGILGYILYTVIRGLAGSPSRKGTPRPQPSGSRGTMVRDEVCDTYLPREEAIRDVSGGEEHFFCSQDCRRAYLDRRRTGRDRPQ